MQPTRGGEVNRLARFRSAPATWLDTLLEEEEGEEEDDDSLKPTQSLTQLLAGSGGPAGGSGGYIPASDPGMFDGAGAQGFLRQSSLPAEFLSQINSSEGYFSSFGIPAGFDYAASPAVDGSPTGKRARELESRSSSRKFSSQSKGEQSSRLTGSVASLLDVDMEKLLEDSVPCRVRAKRGCATHPRSIAERVRRTRISDRIRKLQELVPNMDKQTNTADMLEEAVEYVKFLQQKIQELSEHQKKCTCLARE
ncbi:hypothetical protein PVL29_024767 [Vitis rotundifolia]|uniref:BHLH domain-containing protein n=1 Tax=Vitis rotundifolia TaxID=103349 RepID=A0AA39D9H3_VITRO|nr:hypothetical protein PVL29_024767 [Vitis rotundifolia]